METKDRIFKKILHFEREFGKKPNVVFLNTLDYEIFIREAASLVFNDYLVLNKEMLLYRVFGVNMYESCTVLSGDIKVGFII